ncbi:MAG: FMN-binding protein [Spirochaetaceae bacterium]|nr:FMN-binding protein [Spirochaetaceae bacterium]
MNRKMKMKRRFLTKGKAASVCGAVMALLILLLAGCGKPVLNDGVYSGRSEADDTGAYGEVQLTIAEGNIADCRFVTWQKDGTIKGADYGKVNGEISNQAYYDKAQLAVRAMDVYAQQYVATQKLEAVDAISGATNSHNQFREAVADALEQAAESR